MKKRTSKTHLIGYFIIGIALTIAMREYGWKLSIILTTYTLGNDLVES